MEKKKNGTLQMRLVCAFVFVSFTYLYLNCYQGYILAVAQHVLSGGLTTYSYTIAPILLTLVLFLIQIGVYKTCRVRRHFHGLTYFPSMLLLAILTDISCDVDKHHTFGVWCWIAPLLLVAFGVWMYVVRNLEPYELEYHTVSLFSRCTWENLFQMIVMMVLVGLLSNGDRVFHQRMKMERLMVEGKFDEALDVGSKSLDTDSSMTLLRIACMQKMGVLGERLFAYPLIGGSQAMFVDSVTTKTMIWKAPRWMCVPSPWMKARKMRYALPKDYDLCALLLDKDLDGFVRLLRTCYNLEDTSLPKHYKEALMLYTHRRAHPCIVYRNPVLEADFQDYQTLEHKFANQQERQTSLRDTYGNTYWYYFQFGKK